MLNFLKWLAQVSEQERREAGRVKSFVIDNENIFIFAIG